MIFGASPVSGAAEDVAAAAAGPGVGRSGARRPARTRRRTVNPVRASAIGQTRRPGRRGRRACRSAAPGPPSRPLIIPLRRPGPRPDRGHGSVICIGKDAADTQLEELSLARSSTGHAKLEAVPAAGPRLAIGSRPGPG
jgi:hypothetical protein